VNFFVNQTAVKYIATVIYLPYISGKGCGFFFVIFYVLILNQHDDIIVVSIGKWASAILFLYREAHNRRMISGKPRG
jgi:hypothetical protein